VSREDYLRSMGETESSIKFLSQPSLLEVFGKALDPRSVTMEAAVAAMRPGFATADEGRDAARYRWLRDSKGDTGFRIIKFHEPGDPAIDAAIDAAMKDTTHE
jgi:hypothetical protein